MSRSKQQRTTDRGSTNEAPQAEGEMPLAPESRGEAVQIAAEDVDGGAPPPAEPRERGRRMRTVAHGEACLAHNVRELEAGRRSSDIGNAVTNSARAWLESKRKTKEQQEILAQLEQLREMIAVPTAESQTKPMSGEKVLA